MFFKLRKPMKIFGKRTDGGPYRTNAKNKERKSFPKIYKTEGRYIAELAGRKYLFSKKEKEKTFNYEFVREGAWYNEHGVWANRNEDKPLKKALERFLEKEEEKKRSEKLQNLFENKDK